MARHIWVNPERLKRAQGTRVVDGMELTVEISPYSTPKAVVGKHDQKTGRFVIEFKYIDTEPARCSMVGAHGVIIAEGRHSRKILSISIPVDSPALGKIGVISLRTKIVNALRERARAVTAPDAPDSPDILNQDVAEEILDEKAFTELAGDLVTA